MKTCENFSILITDDDKDCRESLREIVEPQGFRTLQASSGEEAVDILHGEHVHLVLLDVNLPRMNGLETLQVVRQFNQLLPCILVTANATDELMRQAFSVRAYSVIPKPVSKNVLLYTLIRALMKAYAIEEGKISDNLKSPDEHVEEQGLSPRPFGIN